MTTLLSSSENLLNWLDSHLDPQRYYAVDAAWDEKSGLLELFIAYSDTKQGITLEDCQAISHQLEEPLELLPLLKHRKQGYILQVSSPGIARVLNTLRERQFYTGCAVQITHTQPQANKKLAPVVTVLGCGLLQQVDEHQAVLQLAETEATQAFSLTERGYQLSLYPVSTPKTEIELLC